MKYSITTFSLLLLQLCYFQTNAQLPKNLKFKHISLDQGLSSLSTFCLAQDQRGFIWIGTPDGLNQFDGLETIVYKADDSDPYAISSNYVADMCVSRKGGLWIATQKGFNYYDPMTGHFTSWQHNEADSTSLPHNFINRIAEDQDGNVWLGTFRNGVTRFEPEVEKFTHWEKPGDFRDNVIRSLLVDSNGLVWIGSSAGIELFDTNENNFVEKDSLFHQTFRDKPVNALLEDSDGNIWISSGLNTVPLHKYHTKTDKLISFGKLSAFLGEKSLETVRSIEQDQYGRIWLGTVKGLIVYHPENNSFQQWEHDPSNPTSLSSNTIYEGLMEDRQGLIWISGTGGVNLLDPKSFDFNHLTIPDRDGFPKSNRVIGLGLSQDQKLWIASMESGCIYNIIKNEFELMPDPVQEIINTAYGYTFYEDKEGDMWIGGEPFGLLEYQVAKKRIKKWMYTEAYNSKNVIPYRIVFNIDGGESGNLWLGMFENGIVRLNPDNEEFTFWKHEKDNPETLNTANVRHLVKTEAGVWAATFSGLNYLDLSSNKVKHIKSDPSDRTTISSEAIRFLKKDSKGQIWMGTTKGLNKYNPISKTVTRYDNIENLPKETFYVIQEDVNGNIWLGSKNGINKLNPLTNKAYQFDSEDGIQSGSFSKTVIDKKGNLYFAGKKGVTAFHPDSIKENTYLPPVLLSNLLLFNQPVEDSTLLPKSLSELEEITFTHDQYIFGFEFVALNYRQPEKNKYKYKLEGFDEEWVTTSYKYRRATYTDLDAGTYTFMVKASNDDGYWNETPAKIKVIILPPWYLTLWAKSVWVILTIGSLLGFYFWRVSTLKQQKRILELQVEERTHEVVNQKEEISQQAEELKVTNEKLHKLSAFKESMTRMVAHDLKNPLGVIMGLSKEQPKISHMANQMLNLIVDMLDVQKFESAVMKLDISTINFHEIAQNAIGQVQFIGEEKSINLILETNPGFKIKADADLLLRILVNLLTNAIKYTPVQGSISISTKIAEGNYLLIAVSDSGKGIHPDLHEDIFNQFQQVEPRKSGKVASTGVGLAFCKMAIEAMGSDIEVISDVDQGATFQFQLRLVGTYELDSNIQLEVVKTVEKIDNLQLEDHQLIVSVSERLKQLTVHDAFEIEELLQSIQPNSSPEMQIWIEKIIDMAYSGDKEAYAKMLSDILKND